MSEPIDLVVRGLETIFQRDDVRVTHTTLDPGQEIPWHWHSAVADTFYVLRGPLTVIAAPSDERVVLAAGAVFQAAAGQGHCVRNDGAAVVEYLLIQGVGRYDYRPGRP
jgi:quercetin dioxygenase-like cupin family protein